MPCLELLTQLRESQEELSRFDTQVVGVATQADYQAQDLIDRGMPFPLLLDPDNVVRTHLGIEASFSWRRLLHPAGALAYVRAARQARDFQPIWSQATQRPAVVVLDGDLTVRWSYFGEQLGDYPSIEQVLGAVERLDA